VRDEGENWQGWLRCAHVDVAGITGTFRSVPCCSRKARARSSSGSIASRRVLASSVTAKQKGWGREYQHQRTKGCAKCTECCKREERIGQTSVLLNLGFPSESFVLRFASESFVLSLHFASESLLLSLNLGLPGVPASSIGALREECLEFPSKCKQTERACGERESLCGPWRAGERKAHRCSLLAVPFSRPCV
jgi:hypothetical protein